MLCNKIVALKIELSKFPKNSQLKKNLQTIIDCRKIFDTDKLSSNTSTENVITRQTLLKKQQELQLRLNYYSATKME